MIFAWLGARGLFGMAKGLWLVGALLAIMAAIVVLQKREEADDQQNQTIGATIQRESDLVETIVKVEQANEAVEEIKRDPVARRDGCLRHSRTPQNC